MNFHDIDPRDIDPDTGRPYANFSSPSLDTSFHDHEMDGEEVDYDEEDEMMRADAIVDEAPAMEAVLRELAFGKTSGSRMNELMAESRAILARIDGVEVVQ